MSKKILVTYASASGSTAEIAAAIAEELRRQGLEVELIPAQKVSSLAGYDGVVLGAALYIFHWLGAAGRFLKRHRKTLAGGLPIAVFSSGPTDKNDPNATKEIQASVDAEMARLPWLKPIACELFGGRLDPAHLAFPYNLIPAMRNMPLQDMRDWDAIRAWAGALAARFQPVLAR